MINIDGKVCDVLYCEFYILGINFKMASNKDVFMELMEFFYA